jgi:hypothetical protein
MQANDKTKEEAMMKATNKGGRPRKAESENLKAHAVFVGLTESERKALDSASSQARVPVSVLARRVLVAALPKERSNP